MSPRKTPSRIRSGPAASAGRGAPATPVRSGSAGPSLATRATLGGVIGAFGAALCIFGVLQGTSENVPLWMVIAIGGVLGATVGGAFANVLCAESRRRLQRLSEVTRAIARGAPAAIDTRGQDEIGGLARSLSALAEERKVTPSQASDAHGPWAHLGTAVNEGQTVAIPWAEAHLPADEHGADGHKLAPKASFRREAALALSDANGAAVLVVARASGHGPVEAVALSTVLASLASDLRSGGEVAAWLERANRLAFALTPPSAFVALTLVRWDRGAQKGSVISAGGQLPVMHMVSEEKGIRRIQSDGIALGLDGSELFVRSLTSTPFALAAGDAILVGTESLLGTAREDGEDLERALLRSLLARYRKDGSAGGLVEAAFGRVEASADATAIALRRDP